MPNLEERRKHAWDYFQFHAQQRLTTFNFFIVFSSLLAGGLLTTFQDKYRAPALGAVTGIILALVSFVFWKLDSRNKQLIKNAEAALREIEQSWEKTRQEDEPACAVFTTDEAAVSNARGAGSRNLWTRHFSYSQAFNLVYAIMGGAGFAGAAFALWRACMA